MGVWWFDRQLGLGNGGGIGTCEYFCQWTYTNGYVNTYLGASVAAGATSIEPLDLTGILPGTMLTLYDLPYDESIQVASTYVPGNPFCRFARSAAIFPPDDGDDLQPPPRRETGHDPGDDSVHQTARQWSAGGGGHGCSTRTEGTDVQGSGGDLNEAASLLNVFKMAYVGYSACRSARLANRLDYFNNNIESVPNLGAIYRSLPKIASESDLFTNSYSGLGLGAAMYMFFEQQSERRIALGGPPPPYGGGGVKWRDYTLSLLIVFKSRRPQTIDGQIAYMAFIDGLTGIIEAEPSPLVPTTPFTVATGLRRCSSGVRAARWRRGYTSSTLCAAHP